ncbi:hypothetical protein [Paenibacillus oceani]|uniref:Flagellar protein n=1 Tax=Paenibacillus oceani TaxID=2772510 RepID=A0A927C8W1_9BACL|nr:hypothetical protein [Paenibacillus oceani]MBD2861641.1 hypothetical protein [Paenibacillus oceani]
MPLDNCKSCGKLYIRHQRTYCEACQLQHNEYYFTMRDYLKSNPRSTVLDVHEKTGIPISKVLEMHKEAYTPFGR